MNNSSSRDHQGLDDLLADLRKAGERPDRELLDAIKALGIEAL